ncbi:aminomethyl-transferring glycine dehydrogenase subunit GcvPB [Candidatus Micrarchaeota archaeon]|nr:aminomethyl-transferring glycine dehydrogenase subunit GcvPB [Candidatus Micrarchaeota archaeon]
MELIFEKKGTPSEYVPPCNETLPEPFTRNDLPFPETNEVQVVRHYVKLSTWNFGVDSGMYPLGSCTMKYNPKINEEVARLPGFAGVHPLSEETHVQGALQLMYELEEYLKEITGMAAYTLQPCAGAHGELTGVMIAKAYFVHRDEKRHKILIPDSAHGTNPASASICGFEVVNIPSNAKGGLDIEKLRETVDEQTALLMITNPSTLGLFEENMEEIARMVHAKGALLYCDGANLNAMMGVLRPGDQGVDIIHLNLHKTFSTPHGGGGPGAGPVGVTKALEPFLPIPTLRRNGERYALDYDRPKSIGKVSTFNGNFGVLVRAYTYIRAHGPTLKKLSENAVLNANYLMHALKKEFHLPFDQVCAHEFVLSSTHQQKHGVHTMDIAKRLLDHGVHAPTIYFPLIVNEALMIEPTESESKESLDHFIHAMNEIAREARENPDVLKRAPVHTPVGRLDGVLAARKPNVRWTPPTTPPLPSGIQTGSSIHKAQKLVKIRLEYENNSIRKIMIRGDFFMHPEDQLENLEASLNGTALDAEALEARIRSFLETVQVFGFDEKSLTVAILKAAGKGERA